MTSHEHDASKADSPERWILRTPALRELLCEGETVCALVAARAGEILWVNSALSTTLQAEPDALRGRRVHELLTPESAEQLARATSGTPDAGFRGLLQWLDAQGEPVSLECRVNATTDRLVLLGEPPRKSELALQRQLLLLTRELAALARQRARETEQLARAKREVETTYWRLRKIREVLPICMQCQKVELEDAGWHSAVEYLKRHADFLSHGYCPECGKQLEAALDASELDHER